MAAIPEEEDAFGGGGLTQEALDALLAAASAEGANLMAEDIPPPVAPADVTGQEQAIPDAERSVDTGRMGAVDLPSFDSPVSGAAFGLMDLEPEPAGLARVRDIPLDVTVELGRTRLLIRDILDLSAGSIIELDKIAGEPVDLFANGLLVARGEVIVIDDNFGVRVTEIIAAATRENKDANALAA